MLLETAQVKQILKTFDFILIGKNRPNLDVQTNF